MALPGPGGALWAAELLLWAALYLPLGDLIRRLAAQRVGLLRLDDPIERLLVDFYVGGAFAYAVAAAPIGVWNASTAWVLWIGGLVGLCAWEIVRRARSIHETPTKWGRLAEAPQLVAVAAALGLLALELVLAEAAPSGNTFDSSIFATFTGLTQLHHQLPSSFGPVAAQSILYPQGTTAWLAAVPGSFGVPVDRLPLLVTPLFLALVPLAAYVWGRRWWESDRAGAVFAVAFAVLASWPRLLFGGSNDFVFAFPLVLLLWAWMPQWTGATPPAWTDALAFGVLVGYSAAINPVGAELLLPQLVLAAAVVAPRFGGRPLAWGRRWGGALAVALLPVLPSLVVAAKGVSNYALTPGALPPPTTPATTLVGSNLLGLLDPFLFQAQDLRLAPIPGLRLELALLLIVGLGLLYIPGWVREDSPGWSRMRRFLPTTFALVAVVAAVGLYGGSAPGLSGLAVVTSPNEVSLLLFTSFAAVAALPLLWLVDPLQRAGAPPEESPRPRAAPPSSASARPDRDLARTVLPWILVVAIVVPGVVWTTTDVPPYASAVFMEFGNVTAADQALLDWSTAHLPVGTTVLVAPGSAGEFLPGTRPDIRLFFPVAFEANNATYRSVVADLTDGSWTPADVANLTRMGVQYILVTGQNNVLWQPFSPTPLLDDPSQFAVPFHESDAYVFEGPLGVGTAPAPE